MIRVESVPNTLVKRADLGAVATLTLAAPATRNALSLEMIETLIDALDAIAEDSDIRAVVLTGEGPALSAGHDLKELQAHRNDEDRGRAFFELEMARCSELMQNIVALEKPVIAAVEGVATAAGCQLVASCDLAIAGENARFALPGVSIGLFCSTPLVAVGRAISRKHAMEMALTGDFVDARQAERIGLVNRVAPEGTALAVAQELAAKIASRSAATIALGKPTFYRQIEAQLEDAYEIAARAMVKNLEHEDSREGVAAFLEKRAPNWNQT
jgi:enoyl-CoA hydratase/carnithine racemase